MSKGFMALYGRFLACFDSAESQGRHQILTFVLVDKTEYSSKVSVVFPWDFQLVCKVSINR